MVIIGDSLGLPRQTLDYEKTYTYLLKEKLPDWDIINRCRAGNTTRFQLNEKYVLSDLKFLKPDVVVMQFGIADCAPRLFSINQRRLIEVIGYFNSSLQDGIINFFSKHRYFFTKVFPKVYVKKEEFKKNMRKLIVITKSLGAIPIVINIAASSLYTQKRSFGIFKNISDYNSIFVSKEIIDVNSLGEEALLENDHHLNEKANVFITKKIMEKLYGNRRIISAVR